MGPFPLRDGVMAQRAIALRDAHAGSLINGTPEYDCLLASINGSPKDKSKRQLGPDCWQLTPVVTCGVGKRLDDFMRYCF